MTSAAASDTQTNPFQSLPILQGPTLILRPLREEDAEALYQAASDPLIWQQHPDPLRYQRDRFQSAYLAGALAGGSALLVLDKSSGHIVGCSRYYDWNAQTAEVAIGFTFIVRSHWGGAVNSELKSLMLDYAFRHADKVWFHIGKDNWRSRRGTEKIGAVFSHETQKDIGGQLQDYAYYCMTPADQLRIKKA